MKTMMNTQDMTKFTTRVATLLLLAVGVLAATAAVPHFGLAKSMPAADASVESPASIQLWFTQVPQDGSVSIRLVNAAGDAVETGAPASDGEDDKLFAVTVASPLAAGSYTVAWRGIGVDGHVVRDDFSFSVAAQD